MKHEIGNRVQLQVWSSKKKEIENFPGVITNVVYAYDRDYRCHVLLDNGIMFRECAPECCIIEKNK